jgi:putative addiction module component (TIGR02574 family)
MSTQFDQVAADAMKLPLRERVRLAQQLVSTLDAESETGVEDLWFSEAQRRLDELHSGKVEGIEADDAFSAARENLAR